MYINNLVILMNLTFYTHQASHVDEYSESSTRTYAQPLKKRGTREVIDGNFVHLVKGTHSEIVS